MTALLDHFRFQHQPFPRVPPEEAILRHKGIEEAIARLHFALERDTIALLVADSGYGKSTVLALFAKSLDASNHQLVTLSLTTLGPFSLISNIATSLGLRPKRFKGDTAATLLAHLRGLPRRTILVDLRLLTADAFDRRSPFALVLCGQPRLRERLAEPRHVALAQRIGVRIRLRPLTEGEVGLFIVQHLKAAGAAGTLFDAQATAAIFQHARGVPRVVQNLALGAALAAMAAGNSTVDAIAVQQAVVDMEDL
jgi:type II secretory pathway predicted ATPase ExeA